MTKPFSQIRAHAEEIARRRALLKAEAERRGLKPVRSLSSRVWAEPTEHPKVLPSRFFVESYLGKDEPELVEYQLHFPIRDLQELTEAIEALDAFYGGTTTISSLEECGVDGLIDFLKKIQAENHPDETT